MNTSVHEAHSHKLQEVAAEYRSRGYRVLIDPHPEDLPDFLNGFHPDLVAQSPTESVVVEIKVGTQTAASERFGDLAKVIRTQPGWRFSLVVIDPRFDEIPPSTQQLLSLPEIKLRIEEAERLLKTGMTDAAFLLMWACVEALLRRLAEREQLPLERMPSSSLFKELFSLGVLSRSDLEVVQRTFSVRNSIVHGFTTSHLETIAEELSQLAFGLLSEFESNSE